MIATFLKLFHLLTGKQRREFCILQCLMLVSAAAELIGTVSIMPFIALVADPGLAYSNPYLFKLYSAMGEPSDKQFLMTVGAVFVFLIVISDLIQMLSQFLMNRYSFRVGGEISARLYGYYLSRDMRFHMETNSALLIQKVMRDSLMLSSFLISPALRLNTRFFSIFLLTSVIIYVDPLVAMSTVIVLGAVYWFIFQFVRTTIHENGVLISKLGQKRNQTLNESLEGIRDVKLYSFEYGYLSQYQRDTKLSERASADNLILGESPYFIVEAVVLAGMVLLTLYLYSTESNLNAVLPVLTLYCLAGIKIVPKIQQSYQAFTKIRSAQPIFNRLYADMLVSNKTNPFQNQALKTMRPESQIEIREMTFAFDPSRAPIFDHFSETFEAGKVTAISGGSGVGKSTLLEILMGLLEPQSGCIVVDGTPLAESDMPSWRASIGYVPQDVYLTDSSAAENIAFGVRREKIDLGRVKLAAQCARVDEVIEAMPDKYWTPIGERGNLLSGGQKQRIGIARALYRDISLLFLDEATSALDGDTQSEILTYLANMKPCVTIIMITHRSETLAIADKVIRLEPLNSTNVP